MTGTFPPLCIVTVWGQYCKVGAGVWVTGCCFEASVFSQASAFPAPFPWSTVGVFRGSAAGRPRSQRPLLPRSKAASRRVSGLSIYAFLSKTENVCAASTPMCLKMNERRDTALRTWNQRWNNNTLESELISPAGKHFCWSSKTQRKNKVLLWGFQTSKLAVCHVMREPGCGKARKWNPWTASPFWSSGQGSRSHGNPHRPSEPPSTKACFKKSASEGKEEELNWRALLGCFSRPDSTLHTLRSFAQMVSVQDEHEPSAQSKFSDSTSGHWEGCMCQLSSFLKSPDSPSSLLGIVQQVWGERHFVARHSHPTARSHRFWNASEAGSSLRLCHGQSGWKNTYFQASL